MTRTRAGTLAVLILALTSATAADESKRVVYEVAAGKYARRETPLMVRLPEGWQNEGGFALEDLEAREFIPVQTAAYHINGFYGVCWIVRTPMPAGTARRYRLSTNLHKSPPAAGVRAAIDGRPGDGDFARSRFATLLVNDRPVLTYQSALALPPPGIDPVFARSGFLHPLQTPSGAVVTDDFPPDHAHQHGVFFAWVNTTFEGRRVDFWNQMTRTGRVGEYAGKDAYGNDVSGGPVFGELIASLRHEDLTAPPEMQVAVLGKELIPPVPKTVLREIWQILVYDIAGAYVVDFTSAQHVDHHPLTINKYHYGGFGLRGNRRWLDPTVKGDAPPVPSRSGFSDLLTSDGKRRGDGNHTHPRWVDLSGRLDGKVAGVAVLDHPANFRFPQAVRLHPNKPYFCFAPMVEEGFAITHGHPYVSRYRLILHDGPPDAAALERAWHDYAEPPQVRIINEKP